MIEHLYRKSMMLRDSEKKLGALLVTHMPDAIPHFSNDFTTRIKLQYAKEFKADKSDRKDYGFLAIHYQWYNRYAEKVSLLSMKLNWLVNVFFRVLELLMTLIQIKSRRLEFLKLI